MDLIVFLKILKLNALVQMGKFEPTVEEMYKIMNDYNYAKETKTLSFASKSK